MSTTKIAILTSTKPLRRPVMRSGRQLEVIDPRTLMNLAAKFDLVIIASGASEKFYEQIRSSITLKAQPVFKMYSKEFFDRFAGSFVPPEERAGGTSKAWQQILKDNHVQFELQRKVVSGNYDVSFDDFNVDSLAAFISDPRVEFIDSREDIVAQL